MTPTNTATNKPKVNQTHFNIGQMNHILIKRVTEKGLLLGRLPEDLKVEDTWFPRSGFKFDHFTGNAEEVTAYYEIQGWLFDKLTYNQKMVLCPISGYDCVEGS